MDMDTVMAAIMKMKKPRLGIINSCSGKRNSPQ
jgi:hypothetical protein